MFVAPILANQDNQKLNSIIYEDYVQEGGIEPPNRLFAADYPFNRVSLALCAL